MVDVHQVVRDLDGNVIIVNSFQHLVCDLTWFNQAHEIRDDRRELIGAAS